MRRGVVVALLLTACNEVDVATVKQEAPEVSAIIVVDPLEIDFGRKTSLELARASVSITNTGFTLLDVTELVVTGAPGFEVAPGVTLPITVDRNETVLVDVQWSPQVSGAQEATLAIVSDASNAPQVDVRLRGHGAVPELTVTPDPMDFGEHWIPCDEAQAFVLSNEGDEPVVVSELGLGGTANSQLVLSPPELPVTLYQGDTLLVPVSLQPRAPEDLDATLVVVSTDPGGIREVPILGRSLYAATLTDQFTVPESLPVDILFAVDQSCSMDGEAQLLASEFATFISTLGTATDDWRIGVVTLDTGCFNSGVLTSSTPSYESLFRSAVTLGDDGQNLTERLLQLSNLAISRDYPGGCNYGFRSPGAPLHMIMVSDERDQSSGTWQSYVGAYQAYAGDPSLLTVHAIVDTGRRCGDGSGPSGYYDAASSTGGQILDICSASWSANLSNIARQAVADFGVYTLTRRNVDPASLEVTVDGVPMTSGWRFDAGRNAILFDVELRENAPIVVTYGVTPGCF